MLIVPLNISYVSKKGVLVRTCTGLVRLGLDDHQERKLHFGKCWFYIISLFVTDSVNVGYLN